MIPKIDKEAKTKLITSSMKEQRESLYSWSKEVKDITPWIPSREIQLNKWAIDILKADGYQVEKYN